MLSAFVNLNTNELIPHFPATSHEIGNMQSGILNSVLQALDAGIDGTKPIRQQRLRVHIGLSPSPA